jgi:hypothetical protein
MRCPVSPASKPNRPSLTRGQSMPLDRKTILFCEFAQLLERVAAPSSGLGNQDRSLPQLFTTPAQLERWQASVNTLLREGFFRPAD